MPNPSPPQFKFKGSLDPQIFQPKPAEALHLKICPKLRTGTLLATRSLKGVPMSHQIKRGPKQICSLGYLSCPHCYEVQSGHTQAKRKKCFNCGELFSYYSEREYVSTSIKEYAYRIGPDGEEIYEDDPDF